MIDRILKNIFYKPNVCIPSIEIVKSTPIKKLVYVFIPELTEDIISLEDAYELYYENKLARVYKNNVQLCYLELETEVNISKVGKDKVYENI